MTGYFALTQTRHHTRRVPRVPGSAKRRFFNRGHKIIGAGSRDSEATPIAESYFVREMTVGYNMTNLVSSAPSFSARVAGTKLFVGGNGSDVVVLVERKA